MLQLNKIHTCLFAASITLALMATGCCGPMGCGPGCGDYSCYDCDGTAGHTIPYGPLDGLRQFRKNLVCGGGCGEAYIGEWISTPPDACDPCCGDQWVGGATPCRPFCWQPGTLLGSLSRYGGRFCTGAESSAPCGCGAVCDSGYCNECEYGCDACSSDVYSGEVIDSGCAGCATCSTRPNASATRMANRMAGPGMDARVQHIRR